MTLQVQITFNNDGQGALKYGATQVSCLGKPGLGYATDSTIENIEGVQFQGNWKNAYKFEIWNSREFLDDNGKPFPMPWAVKLMGQLGIFIHEGPDNLADNGGPSQGCVHLAPPNAKNFYAWIADRTRIQITYPWNAIS